MCICTTLSGTQRTPASSARARAFASSAFSPRGSNSVTSVEYVRMKIAA